MEGQHSLQIDALFLKNFRNYEETTLPFSPGVNLILGVNGAGKSNIIEAVYMLSTSKSFRKASDRRLLRWGAEEYAIRGVFSSQSGGAAHQGRLEIELGYSGEAKTLSIGGAPENRISSIIGRAYAVLYFFEDVYLVSGPPAMRRSYLDLVLSTVDPLYMDALQRYLAVLRQKNRYLYECVRLDDDLIDVWNEQLAEYGGYVLHKRLFLVDFINVFLESTSGGKEGFEIPCRVLYRSSVRNPDGMRSAQELRDCFRDELTRKRERETVLRRALYGPHRDDFSFSDGRREVRHFASIGEARLSSIVLKLAQAKFYGKIRNVVPILLFDDIFLELDEKNLRKVILLLGEESQKIITTTEKEKLPEIFRCERVFHVEQGGMVKWEGVSGSSH